MYFNNIDYHIVFGDSAAGSLRYYLHDIKNLKRSNVINISDDFSTGPLNNYDTNDGELNRNNWIKRLLALTYADKETKNYYEERVIKVKDLLNKIGKNERILIWYANNISDHIGLRYLSSKIQNNGNNIYGINVSENISNTEESTFYKPISLAEISPENLDLFVPSCKTIDIHHWNTYQKYWNTIMNNDCDLRILENNEVVFVDNTYYDSMIIDECTFEYSNCAKIVGKVLGKSEQIIGDVIIDWRIRVLLKNQKIEGKGFFKKMQEFSIKKKK